MKTYYSSLFFTTDSNTNKKCVFDRHFSHSFLLKKYKKCVSKGDISSALKYAEKFFTRKFESFMCVC